MTNRVSTFTQQQLLEVLLTKKQAEKLMTEYKEIANVFSAPNCEIKKLLGISESKSQKLAMLLELVKRGGGKELSTETVEGKIKKLAVDYEHEDREYIFALFLDAKNNIIADEVISYGGQSGAFMDIPVFYRKAVRLNAYSVVLAHNHPDGSLRASREDIALTENIRQGLKVLGIRLKNHYVLANGEFIPVP